MQVRNEIQPTSKTKRIEVSRPYGSQATRIARNRIYRLLQYASTLIRVELNHTDGSYGIAAGYCSAFNSDAYFVYSPVIGVQTWYSHIGDFSECEKEEECVLIPEQVSYEWCIPLPKGRSPAKQGVFLFDAIMEELEWDIEI